MALRKKEREVPPQRRGSSSIYRGKVMGLNLWVVVDRSLLLWMIRNTCKNVGHDATIDHGFGNYGDWSFMMPRLIVGLVVMGIDLYLCDVLQIWMLNDELVIYEDQGLGIVRRLFCQAKYSSEPYLVNWQASKKTISTDRVCTFIVRPTAKLQSFIGPGPNIWEYLIHRDPTLVVRY